MNMRREGERVCVRKRETLLFDSERTEGFGVGQEKWIYGEQRRSIFPPIL